FPTRRVWFNGSQTDEDWTPIEPALSAGRQVLHWLDGGTERSLSFSRRRARRLVLFSGTGGQALGAVYVQSQPGAEVLWGRKGEALRELGSGPLIVVAPLGTYELEVSDRQQTVMVEAGERTVRVRAARAGD
ncbi:MAG: hypothetical protein MO852_12685, partial [Candidatus Devosia euplotis]|nr:hypothetical protein [Candidatus Devosia euplotis]